jgi:hypothetical protein
LGIKILSPGRNGYPEKPAGHILGLFDFSGYARKYFKNFPV